jgi:NADH-quinone oxidoreductase subunit D
MAKVPRVLRPPKGEAYGRIEGPKGELGFYLVSDGGTNPYRLHIRPPSLLNLSPLRELVIGVKIADAMAIFGSIDICMGEVDR